MTIPRLAGGAEPARATPVATPAVPLTAPKTAASASTAVWSGAFGRSAVTADPISTPPTAYGVHRPVQSTSHPAGKRASVFASPRTRNTRPMVAGVRPRSCASSGKNVNTTPCVVSPPTETAHPAQTSTLPLMSANLASCRGIPAGAAGAGIAQPSTKAPATTITLPVWCVVEPMTVAAEAEPRWFQASTLGIQNVADDDAIEPGPEGAASLEGGEVGE